MITASHNAALAKQFGLESIPDSVQRLQQMIAKRDGNIEDFAKLISLDSELSARVLRAANPRAKCVEDYVATTVEEALQRRAAEASVSNTHGRGVRRSARASSGSLFNAKTQVAETPPSRIRINPWRSVCAWRVMTGRSSGRSSPWRLAPRAMPVPPTSRYFQVASKARGVALK